MLVGMHGYVAGDVVKDVGLGQIVQLIGAPDGNGGGEFAIAQAVKEEKRGDVSADCFCLEARQRLKKSVDIFEAWDTVRIQAERTNAFQKVWIGVALPAGEHPLVQLVPGSVVLFRVELVGLRDVELSIALGLLDKRRLSGGEAGRGDRCRVPMHNCSHSHGTS